VPAEPTRSSPAQDSRSVVPDASGVTSLRLHLVIEAIHLLAVRTPVYLHLASFARQHNDSAHRSIFRDGSKSVPQSPQVQR